MIDLIQQLTRPGSAVKLAQQLEGLVREGRPRRRRAGFQADGIDASHLVVMRGALAAIYRALRACLSAGEKVAVEDPGFNEHHASVSAHSLIPVPVAIDQLGMLPAALSA